MDYWPGGVSGKCGCGVHGECYDPSQVCHCDSGHDGWLQDGGDIHHKEDLPVRALHFGDTGTPLDNKEGRFRLGLLHCKGDDRWDIETRPVRLHGGSRNITDVFFEFLTEAETVLLFSREVDRKSYFKVGLVRDKRIIVEWSSGGMRKNMVVDTEYNINDGRWHQVNVERNIMEVMVVVDWKIIISIQNRNINYSSDSLLKVGIID